MPDATQTVSLPHIASIVRRNRMVIVATIVLAVGAALVLAATSEPHVRGHGRRGVQR